jgi:insertion element IS1 protein InsB
MVTGNRDIETMQRLYEQLKKFKNAVFATDDWDAFAAVLPKNRHKIGKTHTHAIERHNSNTRHFLARMHRRTKVVSQSNHMVILSVWLSDYYGNAENYYDLLKNILV